MNDALYSDKWSPDTYLVTKSYVTDDAPTNTRSAAIKYCPEQYNAFQKLTKENGINDLKKFLCRQNTPASRSLPRLHSRDQMRSGR